MSSIALLRRPLQFAAGHPRLSGGWPGGGAMRCIHLPRWVPDDQDGHRQDQNDPRNILKRFEDPVKKAARARAFGFSNEALKTITGEQAWREYGLTSSDVRHLPCMHRLGVVFDSSDVTRLYNKFEVQDACLRKFGSEVAGNWLKHGGRGVASQLEAAVPQQDPDAMRPVVATQRLSEHLRKRRATVERRKASVRDRAGKCPSLLALGARRRGAGQTGGAGGGGGGGGGNKAKEEQLGSRAVRVAIAGNSAILIAKLGAYAYSGSGAMLSEAMHSGADVMNQGLLFYGLRRSAQKSDTDHPYGYGFETYVWSMISAVGSFFLGAGASIYHGVDALVDATAPHAFPFPGLLSPVDSLASVAASLTEAIEAASSAAAGSGVGAGVYGAGGLPLPASAAADAAAVQAASTTAQSAAAAAQGSAAQGSAAAAHASAHAAHATAAAQAAMAQATEALGGVPLTGPAAVDAALAEALQAEALAAAADHLAAAAPVALGVLAVAGLLEGYSCFVAWNELKREAKKAGMSTWEYIVDGPDPVNVAVFLEDAIAVGGVLVASAGIGLTVMTGNVAFDALGSIGVGLLMGGVSTFVIAKNRRLLGQSVPDSKDEVVELLLQDHAVMSCQDVKAVTIRPGVCRFKAEIQFNPTTLANKYIDQHPDNLPGILASFTRALGKDPLRAKAVLEKAKAATHAHASAHQHGAQRSSGAAPGLAAGAAAVAANEAFQVQWANAMTAAGGDPGTNTGVSSGVKTGSGSGRGGCHGVFDGCPTASVSPLEGAGGDEVATSGFDSAASVGLATTASNRQNATRALAGARRRSAEEAEAAAALRLELHRYSRMLLLTLALEVDRLEQLIRKHHPEYQYIDLEVL